jgi:hypothetical protein
MTTRHSQAAKPERPVKPYRCTGTTSLRGAEKPAKRGMTPESRKLRRFQGLDEITIRKRTYHAGAKREAMYLTRIPQELRLVLAGLTYCANCHSAMVRLGPDYTCHARVNLTPDSCPDNTINADRLLRLVVSQVVGAVMIGPTIRKVTETIQKDAAEMSSRLQEHLEETELALEELDRLGDDLLTPKDQTDGDTTISLKEMVDISNKQIALAFEAGTTRRQIDAQAFISDEDRIRANSLDVDTYLEESSPEQTIEFINNIVESVGVGPKHISVNYKFPIPSEEHQEGRLTNVVPRPEGDQTDESMN